MILSIVQCQLAWNYVGRMKRVCMTAVPIWFQMVSSTQTDVAVAVIIAVIRGFCSGTGGFQF